MAHLCTSQVDQWSGDMQPKVGSTPSKRVLYPVTLGFALGRTVEIRRRGEDRHSEHRLGFRRASVPLSYELEFPPTGLLSVLGLCAGQKASVRGTLQAKLWEKLVCSFVFYGSYSGTILCLLIPSSCIMLPVNHPCSPN